MFTTQQAPIFQLCYQKYPISIHSGCSLGKYYDALSTAPSVDDDRVIQRTRLVLLHI